MTSHGKKMIAPIIITILFLLYLIIYGILVLKAAVANCAVDRTVLRSKTDAERSERTP